MSADASLSQARPPRRVAVIGGGITGLSAFDELARRCRAGDAIEPFLIEAASRLGGVIRTERLEGCVIEGGPDSFLSEKPEAAALCRELGMGDSLIGSNDAERRTWILHQGRLHPLPDGLQFFVPTRLGPVLGTPLIDWAGKLALARDWLTRPPAAGATTPRDESVSEFVMRHFGRAVLENIAEPLLMGVYGGEASALSARSVLARLVAMEQKHGSLTRAVLAARRERLKGVGPAPGKPQPAPPLFTTLKSGLESLAQALAARSKVDEASLEGRVRMGSRVVSLAAAPPESMTGRPAFRLELEDRSALTFEAVILALPALAISRLLHPLDSALGAAFGEIPYTSAMTVNLAYDAARVPRLPKGFGFLVPRHENRRLLACTFVHAKFSHRAPPGTALLRCFLGGAKDAAVLDLDDREIISLVGRDLREIIGVTAEPRFARVYRWPAAMPLYTVGHAARIAFIQERLAHWPGLFVAGNAYSGIGISDCIRTGRAAAANAASLAPGH
jgi:oxygen-dependent protoporphyrinogen oxidase